ncbi:Histone deacetylase complex subunit SAP18 [Schistosoma japonicum]|nr:Histone deacetylase complex subunit SAP18 [Schistosoma japonicum]
MTFSCSLLRIDASLAELAEEVRNVVPVARRRGTRMHFAIVYPDSRGTYGRRQLGVVITGYGSNSGEIDDTPTETTNIRNNSTIQRPFNLLDDSAITLLSKKFQIGDYVDCAIVEYTPGSLVGWSSGRRPLGPPPPTGPDSRSSLREEARMI